MSRRRVRCDGCGRALERVLAGGDWDWQGCCEGKLFREGWPDQWAEEYLRRVPDLIEQWRADPGWAAVYFPGVTLDGLEQARERMERWDGKHD